MRVYRFDDGSGLDGLRLHHEPVPSPQRGELLLRMRAVSLNYRDIAIPLGRYARDSKPGLVPCSDAAAEVVEIGGPATIGQSLRAVAAGGEVTLIGFLSQDNPGVDYFLLKGAGATTRSITVGDRTQLQELVRAVAGTGLVPVIDDIFDFGHAKPAFERLRDGKHIGKLVIRVS